MKIKLENVNQMNSLDKQYAGLLNEIETNGVWEKNRTGFDSKTIAGFMLKHDMAHGFPLLTLKKTHFKSIMVELEGFIKGITDKRWYKERNCNIWNQWCNPMRLPTFSTDEARKEAQLNENDLGKIYGFQWRNFNGDDMGMKYGGGVDQLAGVLHTLSIDPSCRRGIVSAWNPQQIHEMALPPCHVMFQLNIVGGRLNLTWYQRSVDVPLGLPFNIASYGLLLHLCARQLKVEPGILTGFLNNCHFYENQVDGVNEMFRRINDGEANGLHLPGIKTHSSFTDVFSWTPEDTFLAQYRPLDPIKMDVAV